MVEYPAADPGPSFVFPPPRRSRSMDPTEAGRWVGEHMYEAGVTASEALNEVQNLGTVVSDYGDALERKVEPWAVPTIAPLSETINRRADATFQLQGFMRTELPLAGNTQGESGHFHALTGDHVNAGRVTGALAEGWDQGNTTYLAFLTPAINRAYSELWFMVGAVSGTPSTMDVALFVADENRVLRSQIGVHRVSDVIGAGEQLVRVPFDRFVAEQGSYLAVAVRQFSSGTQRPILGLHDTPRPLSNAVFPRKITAQWTNTSSIPATIDGTNDLDFEADWFVPYIELSEPVGVDYRVFTEGWFYEGPEIGRPWVPLTSQGIGSENGCARPYGSGLRVSMYDSPLSTDFVRVRTSIYRDLNPSSDELRSTLVVRGTNDLRSGVGLSAITDERYELITWSNKAVDSDDNWDDRTVLRTIYRSPGEGDQIEVEYLDGQVTVRINGVTEIDALAVGDYSGPTNRFLGIQSRRQAFITWFSSPWFGPWSARDLPQDDSDEGGEEGQGGS